MRWVAIAVALAGCQQVFGIRKLPDAAVFDGPPVCPPGIGHDEDGDCVPDTTDDCPGIADAAQIDADNDTIGDDCDPDPSTPGNLAVVFVPFDQIAEENRWTSIGAWIVNDDDFSNTDTTSGGEDWAYRTPEMYPAGNAIEARITVGAFAAADDVKVGVGFYAPGTTAVEFSCAIHRAAGVDPVVDVYDNGIATYKPLMPPTTFAEGATYTFRMRFDPGQVLCDVRGDGDDVGATTVMNPGALATMGHLAVYTQSAGAQIHNIAVYSAM